MDVDDLQRWEATLSQELRLRGASGREVGEALAAVREYCHDAQVHPDEAFGDPLAYAGQLRPGPVPATNFARRMLPTLVTIGAFAVYQVSAKIQERVINFQDPVANYDSTGYQLSQALFGMSWGGITGTGLGQGHPEIVPVAHSDFILAAIGEELGLIGLAAILVLFALLVSRGFRTAMTVRDSYGKLVAAGLALTIAIQIFVVTAGNTALMPMTGLTTPFMSAGGSSLMANYILLGLILRISNSARRPAQDAAPAQNTDSAGPGTGLFPPVAQRGVNS